LFFEPRRLKRREGLKGADKEIRKLLDFQGYSHAYKRVALVYLYVFVVQNGISSSVMPISMELDSFSGC